jgi:ribosomal protein S18 acetylase RimI-like enzyme
VSEELAPAIGLEQIARIEAHCVYAWPPETVDWTADGWILRATPGLPARGRSNHALTPPRAMAPSEYDFALARAQAFATGQGIECGLQVSPLEIHVPFLEELAARGWDIHQSVLVMTADTATVGSPELELEVHDTATPEWLAAWTRCDPRTDVDAHVQHVFPKMAGIARFVHSGDRVAGISVEHDGMIGLFCLGVAPELRRQGLGKAMVRGMLAMCEAPLTYLQVFSENEAGRALYDSLGFQEAYRYCHCTVPKRAAA